MNLYGKVYDRHTDYYVLIRLTPFLNIFKLYILLYTQLNDEL